MERETPWWRDPWLYAALAVGLFLRVLPLLLWDTGWCARDECIYRTRAVEIQAGEGLTTPNMGWLPAPGYPYLLAWIQPIFGAFYAIKGVQVALSAVSTVVLYLLGRRLDGTRVARVCAFLFALHPTLAWFTGTLWIESIYIFFLLNATLGLLWAREGGPWRAVLTGSMLGLMILFRGVATYLPPLFVLAMIWPEAGRLGPGLWEGLRNRWVHLAVMVGVMIAVVAPWSTYASQRYGGPMISDATAGHVLFLGNNDFPPLTYDYGNGMLTSVLQDRYLRTGRPVCDRDAPPVVADHCERQAALDHILANPGQFIGRIPERLAQLFNPNSFLTRHLRWGKWEGLPFVLKEGIAGWVVLTSFGVILGGTLGALARARGPLGVLAVGFVVYTSATIAVSYGMTRFRLPMEAIWLPYLAFLLAYPRRTLELLRASPVRLSGALLGLPALFILTTWYLRTGFPWLW